MAPVILEIRGSKTSSDLWVQGSIQFSIKSFNLIIVKLLAWNQQCEKHYNHNHNGFVTLNNTADHVVELFLTCKKTFLVCKGNNAVFAISHLMLFMGPLSVFQSKFLDIWALKRSWPSALTNLEIFQIFSYLSVIFFFSVLVNTIFNLTQLLNFGEKPPSELKF